MISFKKITFIVFIFYTLSSFSQINNRLRISLDKDWKFAFGHPYDTEKDFNTGTGYFSYLAKATYGDGAAALNFDDRAWRVVNVPHDWAAEQGFSEKASYSHGFKTVGRKFPESSVGWYRKTISIAKNKLGKRFHIAFDGVSRDAKVWFNGHYLGNNPSGYLGFEYDVTDYTNYDQENVIAVRADATMEEGWFYEGAGIYRHVWLNETNELHVPANGTFVQTKVNKNNALIYIQSSVINEGRGNKRFKIINSIVDSKGKELASHIIENLQIKPMETQDFSSEIAIENPHLWSLEDPYLHTLVTKIYFKNELVDAFSTTFGIRTIKFDPDKGFFLNGKNIKIKGTNNHQDHAGVGTAIPDALQEFRIKTLKSFGSNAYRCSHNPPTPELLDACDRLGMLVIDENRLMGITSTHLEDLKKMMIRDRNHPSIISWSIANEEWGVEGDIKGARMAQTMQDYAKLIDSSRSITAGMSGNWDNGIATVIDVIGYNYIKHGSTDKHHKNFPHLASWGTEEGSTFATRGIYFEDEQKHFKPAYDLKPVPTAFSIEEGWKHYAARPYLAGMFVWTGFDYRGESTPYQFPSVGSYFGMVDQCGFYKDTAWYLKSWWQDQPVLHILPHWNWKGKENSIIKVWVYSNCQYVELFLNNKSLAKKQMQPNGHLEWDVNYAPGTLKAVGVKDGKMFVEEIKTTQEAKSILLVSDKKELNAYNDDVALITVAVKDRKGLEVPTADNLIEFSISGPGRIIGVGNGNPTSLEADQYLDKNQIVAITNLKEKIIEHFDSKTEISNNGDDSNWNSAFTDERDENFGKKAKAVVYRAQFVLPVDFDKGEIKLHYLSLGKEQSIYINENLIAADIPQSSKGDTFILDKKLVQAGVNTIVIQTTPILKNKPWDEINKSAGNIQLVIPGESWKRKLFSGLAQVIVQTTGAPGTIKLKATTKGLETKEINITTK